MIFKNIFIIIKMSIWIDGKSYQMFTEWKVLDVKELRKSSTDDVDRWKSQIQNFVNISFKGSVNSIQGWEQQKNPDIMNSYIQFMNYFQNKDITSEYLLKNNIFLLVSFIIKDIYKKNYNKANLQEYIRYIKGYENYEKHIDDINIIEFIRYIKFWENKLG